MEKVNPDLMGVLISWLPFLVIVAVWIFVMRKMPRGTAMNSAIESQKNMEELVRESNRLLAEISEKLDSKRDA